MSVRLRNRTLKSGAKSYYLDIHHNGKRWREFLKIKILPKDPKRNELKRLIDEMRAQKELELLSDDVGRVPDHLKNIRFDDFAEKFIQEYKKADIRVIKNTVAQFRVYNKNPSLRIVDISEHIIDEYATYLNTNPNLSGHTPHTYFSRFKRILKSAKRQGIISKMPTEDYRFKRNKNQNKKREIITIEELEILYNTRCGNNEVKKAFIFACQTGIGEAEARKLSWKDLKNDKIRIVREKTGIEIENLLSPLALTIVGASKGKDERVFGINKISFKAVNKNLKNWVSRAGIEKNITFYSARHSYAVMLLKGGANLKAVADLMGHTNIKTTTRYLNYLDAEKNKAINNLPSFEL